MALVEPLTCSVQKYAWGKIGSDSFIYQLLDSNDKNEEPLAELWMGTHPSGPSFLKRDRNISLENWLKIVTPDNYIVPFLFKVLSIRIPLSIQAHPDKALAEKLHAQFPDIYKDSNHKPELACAITPFRALCGFLPLSDILTNLTVECPELGELVGNSLVEELRRVYLNHECHKSALKALITQVSSANEQEIRDRCMRMISRLQLKERKTRVDEAAISINEEFEGDIGVFFAYLLNYVELTPGEAIFLDANEPHAYLSGDCVECMACSDNVVRMGLTPKFKDVHTLCEMLSYNCGAAAILQPERWDDYSQVYYSPKIHEFKLIRTILPAYSNYNAKPIMSHAIVIIVSGSGKLHIRSTAQELILNAGVVLFVCSGECWTITSDNSLQLFICTTNST